jgi:hypothetical protein
MDCTSIARAAKARRGSHRDAREEVELLPVDEVLRAGGDFLDNEERARLQASLRRGLEDVTAGRTTDARQVIDKLKTRAVGR